MVKLEIVAAIVPAATWWYTTDCSQSAISEPVRMRFFSGDLPSAGCLARSPTYLVSRSNDAREITEISHWSQSLHD